MLTRPSRPRQTLTRAGFRVDAGAEAVTVRGLAKAFEQTPVLDGVDLSVPAGSLVALLGPSGCGKTTLLRTIAGLERAERGLIEVGSRMVAGPGAFVPPERRRVGMVFQDWALFPHLTVAANVGFGLPRAQRRSGRVDDILAMIDMREYGDRLPSTLSGGQQQRVALGRALATRPSVILLDEPFSNLDASLRVQLRNEMKRMLRRLGITTLFVTHDQEEAFCLGESVAVMFDGKVVQQAAPGRLYESPATRTVAEFIGDANFLPGSASGLTADTELGRIRLLGERFGPVDVVLRPEDVLVEQGDDAEVEDIEFYGHDAVYLLRTDGGRPLSARVLASPRFRAGDRVGVRHSGRPAVAFELS